MVEVSLTLLATAVSTIILVTMTTLFFCCWRKKGSREIVTSKPSSTKEDLKKERSVSPAPAAVERVENGLPAENASIPGLLVTSEDLGDFSAVQRETEILRSYRKPPPPKNRGRQSRAPRHLKNDKESLDIFTELSEEDGKNEISSDKENICPDEPDSALLRPHSEGKDRPTRDTRSSLLMDIEQTLATLHMSEPSTTAPSEGSLSEDKSSPTHFSITVTKDIQDEKSEVDVRDYTESASNSCPVDTLFLSELTAKAASINVASSPKLNHSGRPKQGPKVSPKPSPRSSARISSVDISTTASVESEKSTEPSVVNSLSLNQSFDSKASSDNAVNSEQSSPSNKEMETTDIELVQGPTSSGLLNLENSTCELATANIKPHTLVDNTESGVLSIPADTTSRDELKSEDAIDNSNDRPDTVKLSDSTNALENPISDITNDADASNISVDNRRSNCITETGDCDPTSKVQPESTIHLSDNKEGNSVPACADDVSQSPAVEITLEREAASVPADGTSLEENATQQKESTNDPTGEGKSSKIRSSP